jgi:outer membrane protein TolC
MLGSNRQYKHFFMNMWGSVPLVAVAILAIPIAGAQDVSSNGSPSLQVTPAIRVQSSGGLPSPPAAGVVSGEDSADRQSVRPTPPRRITIERVKQQAANRIASPLAYMSQLSVEAAKQHRLAVQADYFPKFGATFLNLHTTDFLGRIARFTGPFMVGIPPVPVQIFNQNQTFAALTFVQPITPLFEVRQAVRIARADERIAMAKAAPATSKKVRDAEIEDAYFNLLIAQRKLTVAQWKFKNPTTGPLYASISTDVVHVSNQEAATIEARKAVETASARVRELTASLNRHMGWPDDTELELAVPDPLVENVSLQDVSDKSTTVRPVALVEAEQTVVKARAAASISKMAYVPVVVAISGYLFQNVIPAVNSNFGYGGVMASYNLFDFGKREHTVREARAQLEMAETALQLTKIKVANDLKKSYFDLERARQLSQVTQKMGSSAALLMRVASDPENLQVRAARADVEVEMLEADYAHRRAYYALKALIDWDR